MQIYFLEYLSEPEGPMFCRLPTFGCCLRQIFLSFAGLRLSLNSLQKCCRLCFGLLGSRAGAEEEEEEKCACTREGREDGLRTHTEGRNKKNNKRNPNTGDRRSSAFRGWPRTTLQSWAEFSQHLLELSWGLWGLWILWSGAAAPSPAGWWAATSHPDLSHLSSKS